MNNKTEIVFILDRSGSMHGLESDTIGGFNSFLDKQRLEEGQETVVSVVLFDDISEVLFDRQDIRQIPKMTAEQYFTRGCTALLDAIGGAIHHIGNVHKYARPEDVPAHTLFVITTDGMENASEHYSYKQVKKMITREQEKYGWEFIFMGANIDSVKTAETIGIHQENAVNYIHDEKGVELVYDAVVCAAEAVRKGMRIQKSPKWKERLSADYADRSK